MTCQFLKQVVMLYCDACPVKKMVPLDQLVSASPCLLPDHVSCPLYVEVMTKLGELGEEEERRPGDDRHIPALAPGDARHLVALPRAEEARGVRGPR